MKDDAKLIEIVRENYKKIAIGNPEAAKFCREGEKEKKVDAQKLPEQVSMSLGYTEEAIASVPWEANMGLGCGTPILLAAPQTGETVVDLGCGTGFDCFLATHKVGENGHVIGVDMTAEMIGKAREIARRYHYHNVEFRLGEIEHLPLADASADAVISNCVINLSPDKEQVYREIYRVLKKGGRIGISDIVLVKELTDDLKNDEKLYCG